MGMSLSEGSDDDDEFGESHEINVTPFIDVILVLLIIFMVAAPLSTVDLPVDLPSSTAVPQKKPDKPTYVTIKPDLALAIGENFVKRIDLVRSLDAMPDVTKDKPIFVRADKAVPYGEFWSVLEILRAGGYTKVKLVALEGVPDGAVQAAPPGGAATALLLHAGAVAAAFYQFQPEETGDGPGDDGLEVSLELALPNAEPTEVPPGPDSTASAASPALAEQKAVEKEADLPQDIPQEAPEPDRVVTENKAKKPDDEQPEKAVQQQQASQESVAAEEAQRQKLMGDKRRATEEWSRRLSRHLEKHKRYPGERQQKAAEVTVSFTLDRVGHVLAVSVVKSSGDAAFDEAALAMVRRSDPVPAPPAVTADDGLSFTVPVIFTKGKG